MGRKRTPRGSDLKVRFEGLRQGRLVAQRRRGHSGGLKVSRGWKGDIAPPSSCGHRLCKLASERVGARFSPVSTSSLTLEVGGWRDLSERSICMQ